MEEEKKPLFSSPLTKAKSRGRGEHPILIGFPAVSSKKAIRMLINTTLKISNYIFILEWLAIGFGACVI